MGRRVELFRASIQLVAASGDQDSIQEMGKLEAARGKYPESAQPSLLSELAVGYEHVGDLDASRRLLLELRRDRPNDVQLLMMLFSIAIRQGDFDRGGELIAEIQNIEGAGGINRRLAEADLIVAKDDPLQLPAARMLALEVRETAPHSPVVATILGRIERLLGNDDDSIEYFLEAVEFGQRGTGFIFELINSLAIQSRYADAERVLRILDHESGLPLSIGEIAADVSLQTRNYPRALRLATRAVNDDPASTQKRLWLARVQAATGDAQAAELTIRDAVALDEQDPAVWVTLVALLARNARLEEAMQVIETVEEHVPAELAALALAQCYEEIGNFEAAEQRYHAILESDPSRDDIAWKLVQFNLRRGEIVAATELLERLIGRDAPKRIRLEARRELSTILALRGPYQDYQRALLLIDENLAESPKNVRDLIAKALLLKTRRDRVNRRQAMHILESVYIQSGLSTRDAFDLARLRAELGEWEDAVTMRGSLDMMNPQLHFLSSWLLTR